MSPILFRRSGLASLPLLALGIAWPLNGQTLHADDYVGRVDVIAGLSGAQLSYRGLPTHRGLADSFHAVANRLQATRERWDDAALLHVFAANLRGPADPGSVTDLLLAADLFSAGGEYAAACAVLQRAAAISVRAGRLRDARYCRQRARLTGSSRCSEAERSRFAAMVVPAPGPITVEAPDLRTREEPAPRPSHLPAAPGPIIVDPPDLLTPGSSGTDIGMSAPALIPPELVRPEV